MVAGDWELSISSTWR